MTTLSRRCFFIRWLPALVIAPLSQWMPPESPPGADTPENLTQRVTWLEFGYAGLRAVIAEQGKMLVWVGKHLRTPGNYGPEKPRKI